jgi:REP element-mobilizing transposase RayT
MTYPRSQIAPPDQSGFYHVVSRCVRRAFLCGSDRHTGRNFNHRRQWIEDRIRFLAESFAVSIYAYTIMSNHFHTVLAVEPDEVANWSDRDVAERWLAVFPGALKSQEDPKQRERVVLALCRNTERLEEIRLRLGSLSWFMRALNEPIARMANREDDCTGRFWEGRFKCQVLLEAQAVVSAMAYVDLNPVRAKMAEPLVASEHTSIRARINERASRLPSNPARAEKRLLKPVAGLQANALLGLEERSYLDLVQWTGEQAHPLKRGKLDSLDRETAPMSLGRWQKISSNGCGRSRAPKAAITALSGLPKH